MKVQLNDIRDEKTWGGKEPENHSPAFDYCRRLLANGADPSDCLEVYRSEKLAYTVSTIGWGATKKIRENQKESAHVVDYVAPDEKALARFAAIRAQKRSGTHRRAI